MMRATIRRGAGAHGTWHVSAPSLPLPRCTMSRVHAHERPVGSRSETGSGLGVFHGPRSLRKPWAPSAFQNPPVWTRGRARASHPLRRPGGERGKARAMAKVGSALGGQGRSEFRDLDPLRSRRGAKACRSRIILLDLDGDPQAVASKPPTTGGEPPLARCSVRNVLH